MTPQEESMLNDLIGRVEQTQLSEKDPEAEQLLNQRLGQKPECAVYPGANVAGAEVRAGSSDGQLEQLRRQQTQVATQPAHTTSFLGSLLGHRDPAPPPPPPPPAPGYGAPPPSQGWNNVPAFGGPSPMGGGSSFLRSAATTAAGVAAGSLAFQGIESLLHGFGHESGFGGGGYFGGGGGGRPEEIINNYYGDAGQGSGEHHSFTDTGFGDSNNDAASNLRDDLTDPNDISLQSPSLDDVSVDDTPLDDSSFDDTSSFDDSSSGDDLA